ncbi:MAG: tyrosine-type recombinase/integrase [Stellaceae bacterium]
MNKLTVREVEAAKKAGRAVGDGGGLWFIASRRGSSFWAFRYSHDGRAHSMGLGVYPDRTLAEARELATDARRRLQNGRDPLQHRRAEEVERRAEEARRVTFRQVAEQFIEDHAAGWGNAKHSWQWGRTLELFAYPIIGDKAVGDISTDDVLAVLRPIWTTKGETASRVRGRIENVLDASRAAGLREGDNPAHWRGHLDKLLPSQSRTRSVEHHAALPYAQLPTFWKRLDDDTGIAAKALRFTILTAARTGEVLGMTWDEIRLDERIWIVPAGRMKAGRQHRVPLSVATLAILDEMRTITGGEEYVFPGMRPHKPLSNMSMVAVLRRMGRGGLTVHGFRSSFRDWCAERGVDHDLAEMALAHTVGNKVEAAYRRSDLFERRRALAEFWAAFSIGECEIASDNDSTAKTHQRIDIVAES